MQPPVAIDIYRDGGSLGCTFRDSEGQRRVLFLQVLQADDDRRLGYADPQLHFDVAGPSHGDITWSEAALILEQVEALPSNGHIGSELLPAMSFIVRNKGAIPPGLFGRRTGEA